MEIAVYNIKGEDTGRKVVLSDEVFAAEANEHAVYLDVIRSFWPEPDLKHPERSYCRS